MTITANCALERPSVTRSFLVIGYLCELRDLDSDRPHPLPLPPLCLSAYMSPLPRARRDPCRLLAGRLRVMGSLRDAARGRARIRASASATWRGRPQVQLALDQHRMPPLVCRSFCSCSSHGFRCGYFLESQRPLCLRRVSRLCAGRLHLLPAVIWSRAADARSASELLCADVAGRAGTPQLDLTTVHMTSRYEGTCMEADDLHAALTIPLAQVV